MNNKNDSKCDLLHYLSDYSIDSLIATLIESKQFQIDNFKIKNGSLKFIEGLNRVYGPHIDQYNASVKLLKARLLHNQDDISLLLLVEWQIMNPYS